VRFLEGLQTGEIEMRPQLNGSSGAGIIDDLQDLIGRSVWTGDDSVISYHEFGKRLLSDKGWGSLLIYSGSSKRHRARHASSSPKPYW
jgi:hypothetical protein